MNSEIEKIIRNDHENDEEQLEAIFSDKERIVVEAPAGCGKTKTMVSKVAYMIAEEKIAKNKKILALTFSVNAAYKMKKDILDKLPSMGVVGVKTPKDVNKRIFITNYHGFSRRILHLYGYILDERLKEISSFKAMNEEEVNKLDNIGMTQADKDIFEKFCNAVKTCNIQLIENYQEAYYNVLCDKLFSERYITYNGYLLICKKLLKEYATLKKFLQKLYPIIIIDEFQDTNVLSWNIVEELVNEDSKLFFMGDSLQRIYGFIGAIPNLLDDVVNKYGMYKVKLEKNYRFKNNKNMLLLDKNIRLNAENFSAPSISENADISVELFENQEDEATWVAVKVAQLLEENDNDKIAILVNQRGANIDVIMDKLKKESVDYFYALFSDEDIIYINYHKLALKTFFEELSYKADKRVNGKFLNTVYDKISSIYEDKKESIILSLLMLTRAFFNKILKEYSFLNNEEKISFINDTFESNALKQNMDSINNRVIVSTVHGAKGLEWENVIMPDMEPYIFPNYFGLCGSCDFKKGRDVTGDFCRIVSNEHNSTNVIEELSVFYVGVTRARKQVFFSASKFRYNNKLESKKSYISCLLTLPGINII